MKEKVEVQVKEGVEEVYKEMEAKKEGGKGEAGRKEGE